MANLKDCTKWNIHDDFYTRKKTWEQITPFIDKDKIIYEFCLLNSNEQSKKYLEEFGYSVIGNRTIDFLENNQEDEDCDILVSNIPFSSEIKKKILIKLVKLDKPFIIIMNSLNLFTKYFMEIFKNKDIFFIYPSTKIHYDKYVDDKLQKTKNNTSFYSIYVCYKVIDKNIWI
jgi:UDP-N-acetylglucosamine 2-epimerase